MRGVDIIKQFVEGRISPRAFEQCLHTDAALQVLLEGERNLPAYVAECDLYLYLISQDYESLACIYNVQTLLSERLDVQGIAHAVDDSHERRFTLALNAQPKWLSLPPAYISRFMADHDALDPKALKTALKAAITRDFRYLKAPPKWLQEPEWPLADDVPMVFVGQLDIRGLGHDTGQAYLFFDAQQQRFHTVSQRC
jgi:hypothetical protein